MGAWARFGEGVGRVREYFGGVWEEFEGSFNGVPSMGASGFVEGFGKEAPETSETACF